MAKSTSVPTRVALDLIANAERVGAIEHRSTAEQINHWARIGMQFERSATVDMRRSLAAATGHAQFGDLDADERAVAHAIVDANIMGRVATTQFGPMARQAGQRTVSIDDDGSLVEIGADGSRRRL